MLVLLSRGIAMPLDDIANALKLYRAEVRKRDREFGKLLRAGWRLSRLADRFKISRQRAQQIAAKLRKLP